MLSCLAKPCFAMSSKRSSGAQPKSNSRRRGKQLQKSKSLPQTQTLPPIVSPRSLKKIQKQYYSAKLKLLDVEVRKTKAKRLLYKEIFSSQCPFEGYFSYRTTELSDLYRPSFDFLETVYDRLSRRGINMFWDHKDLPAYCLGSTKSWYKGARSSKFYVAFLSEKTLAPLKDHPITGFGSEACGGENRDDLLEEYEKAVNVFDSKHIILVLMGRWSHMSPPAEETDEEEETSPWPASFLRTPNLDPLDYPQLASDTCQSRTVSATMSALFHARTVIRVNPRQVEAGADEIADFIDSVRTIDPFADSKSINTILEDEVMGMFEACGQEYQRIGNLDKVKEIKAIRGRMLGDRLMSEVPRLLQRKDYSTCVSTIKKAGSKYRAAYLGKDVVPSSDQLTQIIQHEDVSRKSQTRYPRKQVGRWASMEAERLYQQAEEQYNQGNLMKALYLATESGLSFSWANDAVGKENAQQLVALVQGDVEEEAVARKKKRSEDAAKPKADEVNIKFKAIIMEDSSSVREMFEAMDEDRSGVLNGREFRKVIEKIGCKMTTVEFRKLYKKYDPDGDGISYDEFLHSIVF